MFSNAVCGRRRGRFAARWRRCVQTHGTQARRRANLCGAPKQQAGQGDAAPASRKRERSGSAPQSPAGKARRSPATVRTRASTSYCGPPHAGATYFFRCNRPSVPILSLIGFHAKGTPRMCSRIAINRVYARFELDPAELPLVARPFWRSPPRA